MDMRFEPKNGQQAKDGQKQPAGGKHEEKIKGIFSTQSVVKVGTGTTTRRTIQKTYWYVLEIDPETIEIQPLNRNYIPSGPKRKIPKDEFLQKFSPEPEFYVSTVFPKMKELSGTITRGEKHRANGELYSAEFEFGQALKVDEENVRANFGLGLTYMERGEKNKANDILERLVKLDAAFGKEHKHLFNDFGISLRKSQMYDQAVDYYRRAIELTQEDENLMLNIARAYFEKGDMKNCVDHLKRAIGINPDIDEARQFWAYMQRKGFVTGEYPGKPGAGRPAAARPAPNGNGVAKNGNGENGFAGPGNGETHSF